MLSHNLSMLTSVLITSNDRYICGNTLLCLCWHDVFDISNRTHVIYLLMPIQIWSAGLFFCHFDAWLGTSLLVFSAASKLSWEWELLCLGFGNKSRWSGTCTCRSLFFSRALAMVCAASTPMVFPSSLSARRPSNSSIAFTIFSTAHNTALPLVLFHKACKIRRASSAHQTERCPV